MLNKLIMHKWIIYTPLYYWYILIRHDMYRLNNDYKYLNFDFWYMLNVGYYEMVNKL
jgi:hypothetical protein